MQLPPNPSSQDWFVKHGNNCHLVKHGKTNTHPNMSNCCFQRDHVDSSSAFILLQHDPIYGYAKIKSTIFRGFDSQVRMPSIASWYSQVSLFKENKPILGGFGGVYKYFSPLHRWWCVHRNSRWQKEIHLMLYHLIQGSRRESSAFNFIVF